MEFVNQLHPNVTQRACSHCRRGGHNIRVCNEAYIDGMTMHNIMLEIINVNIVYPNNLDQAIRAYLITHTLHELKVLSFVIRDLNNFVSNLYDNHLITFTQYIYSTKRDLIVVLGFYYQKICLEILINISNDPIERNLLLEQIRPFNTIQGQRRLYGDTQIYPYVVSPRKFEITTSIQASNKGDNFECPICYDDVLDTQRITSNCCHDVCMSCFDTYLSGVRENDLKKPICCMCRSNITNISFTQEECYNKIKNKFLN